MKWRYSKIEGVAYANTQLLAGQIVIGAWQLSLPEARNLRNFYERMMLEFPDFSSGSYWTTNWLALNVYIANVSFDHQQRGY